MAIISLVLFTCFTSLNAQSFYSSRGIGLVHHFVSGRAAGMGGVGIAFADNLTVSFLNPASLSSLPFTTISGNFRHEFANLKSSFQEASITDTNVSGAQFVIPLKQNRVAIALGLNPYTSVEFSFVSDETSTSEKQLIETVSGDGGVNNAFFTLSIRPFERLSLGVTGLFYFGILRNIWRVDFTEITLLDTQTEVSQSISGINFRAGAILKILSNWSIAGVFTPAVTLDTDNSVNLRVAEFSNISDGEIKLPMAFGLGTSFLVGKKLLVGVDYYRQKWSEFGKEGLVNDSERIAFGFEYSGRGSFRSSYFSRMAVRAGFYYQNLGLELPTGNEVTELFGTIGLSLPIKWNVGRIDVALELGKRGSTPENPFRENVIRLTGSITVGEKWFFRPKRK